MSNKAVLLRSVSTLATAAASTALGVHGAQAQVVPAGTDGYYYSVTGGFAFSKSEAFLTGLEDKVGYGQFSGSGSSSYDEGSYSGYSSWSASGSSYTSGLDDYKGIFASVSFGKQFGEFDIRGTLSTTNLSSSGYAYGYTEHSSYYTFSGSGFGSSYSGSGYSSASAGAYAEGELSVGFSAADFEVGYTPTLGNNFNVRLFAGIRALRYTSTFTGSMSGSSYFSENWQGSANNGSSYTYSGYYNQSSFYEFEGKIESIFTGIGPRVGMQASTRFEGTNFGLSGSVATSVLFGKQTVTTSGYYSSYTQWGSGYSASNSSSSDNTGSYSGSSYISGSSYEANKTVLDLQASASVDYYLNDSTALSIGYQVEKLWEVAGDNTQPGTEINTLAHGAFVKLSGSF